MKKYVFFQIFTLQEVAITIQDKANERPEYFHASPNFYTDSADVKSTVTNSQTMK
jgi:hypothetical protein